MIVGGARRNSTGWTDPDEERYGRYESFHGRVLPSEIQCAAQGTLIPVPCKLSESALVVSVYTGVQQLQGMISGRAERKVPSNMKV